MIGREEAVVKRLESTFRTLAPNNGWAYAGGIGAGHYVKMVHNGIEYRLVQGYSEGFELIAKSEYKLNLAKIPDLWMHGSVIRTWPLGLGAVALKQDPKLE